MVHNNSFVDQFMPCQASKLLKKAILMIRSGLFICFAFLRTISTFMTFISFNPFTFTFNIVNMDRFHNVAVDFIALS